MSRKCILRVLIDQIKRLTHIDFWLLRRVQYGFQVYDPERIVLTAVRGFHRKQNVTVVYSLKKNKKNENTKIERYC